MPNVGKITTTRCVFERENAQKFVFSRGCARTRLGSYIDLTDSQLDYFGAGVQLTGDRGNMTPPHFLGWGDIL